ncbi:MAG: exodeoxyribonuclease VII small subunit [Rhodothermaceae bacterium]|nr:exodeoxyribonuclease VII small subunit [Rhodothermaceae bacterium]
MSSPTDKEQEDSFEERLTKLESIVNLLENETPPLEEALNSYEKGVEIAKVCLKQLEQAELRVRTIRLDD